MANYYNQNERAPNPNFYGGGGGGAGYGEGGPPSRKRRYDDGSGGGGAGRANFRPYQPRPQNQHNAYPSYGNGRMVRNPAPVQAQTHPRSDTNLIVNYLPQTFSDEEMRATFSPFGDIESCRIMRDKTTGYSFGYGFVNFCTPDAAASAIQSLNGIQVQNKVIKVSLARPPSTEIQDTNLYITNLPRETTPEELVTMFSPYGNIVQKNILYDKYTQLPRGVAFVRYDLREQANAAISAMNDYIPPGASEGIKVRLAENHGKHKANYVAGFQAGYSRNGRGGGAAAGGGGRF